MQMAVASGKGGTGKTTVAVNLAHVLAEEGPIQLLDCDVEEPNAHLFLHPTQHEVREVNIRVPVVDRARCTGCGKCVEACAFHAIAVLGEKALVFPELLPWLRQLRPGLPYGSAARGSTAAWHSEPRERRAHRLCSRQDRRRHSPGGSGGKSG